MAVSLRIVAARDDELTLTMAPVFVLSIQSGFGFHGGRSRCFTHWQEFQKCYAQADVPADCTLQADDYIECLHHKKEIERNRTIRDTFLERQAHEAKHAQEKGELRTTSSILRLGIIGREAESDSNSSSSSGGESAEDKKTSGKEPIKGTSKRDDK